MDAQIYFYKGHYIKTILPQLFGPKCLSFSELESISIFTTLSSQRFLLTFLVCVCVCVCVCVSIETNHYFEVYHNSGIFLTF